MHPFFRKVAQNIATNASKNASKKSKFNSQLSNSFAKTLKSSYNNINTNNISNLSLPNNSYHFNYISKSNKIATPVLFAGIFSWLTGDSAPQEEDPAATIQEKASRVADITRMKKEDLQNDPDIDPDALNDLNEDESMFTSQQQDAMSIVTSPINTTTLKKHQEEEEMEQINAKMNNFNQNSTKTNTVRPQIRRNEPNKGLENVDQSKLLNSTRLQVEKGKISNEVVIDNLDNLAYPLPPIQQRAKDAFDRARRSKEEILVENEFNDRVGTLREFYQKNKPTVSYARDVDEFKHFYNLNRQVNDLENELPSSKRFSHSNNTDDDIVYPYGQNDVEVYDQFEREYYEKRAKEGNNTVNNPFEYEFYQRARLEQYYKEVEALRKRRKEMALGRDENDRRNYQEKAQDTQKIDGYDLEGFPGGNKWDSSYSGYDLTENDLDIDWLNPSHIDIDRAIELVEQEFKLPFSSLMRRMPMSELQRLLIKTISQWQWYWIEDEQDRQRLELMGQIEKARINQEWDDIYDLPPPNPLYPDRTPPLPPPIEFPQDGQSAFICELTPKQQEQLNCAMHIITASYFGDENTQLESQQYSLEMIEFFEKTRSRVLNEHEEMYIKRRNDNIKLLQSLQQERNEIYLGKRNFDARVIANMESRIASKLQWRDDRDKLGLSIEYDMELDEKIDTIVENQFQMIKEASKLIKLVQEQEEHYARIDKPDIVSDDLMTEIDNKINKILDQVNKNASEEYLPTNAETKPKRIIKQGRSLADLSIEELVIYNRALETYKQNLDVFDANVNEFRADEHAFKFQLDNNKRRQDATSITIEQIDDEFVDLMDSYYVEEKQQINADLYKNLFSVFDITSRLEQYEFLAHVNILPKLPQHPGDLQPTPRELELSINIIDSIFTFNHNKDGKINGGDEFFYDEVRNVLKRLDRNEHSLLKLRPRKDDPAIEQYRSLRRAAYYKTQGKPSYFSSKSSTLEELLTRMEKNDPTLTKVELDLVKDFILNPHKHDGAELDYFSVDLDDDPTKLNKLNDFGLTAREAYASIIDDSLANSPPNVKPYDIGLALTPTGPIEDSGYYTPDQLQKMLIIDQYEQTQRKYQRRKELAARLEANNGKNNKNRKKNEKPLLYQYDLIQPYDPFYLTMGIPIAERQLKPVLDDDGNEVPIDPPTVLYHELKELNTGINSRKLPYFYSVELDAMNALPLNHFESYYTSKGNHGVRKLVPFEGYFGLDIAVDDDRLIDPMQSIYDLPTVLEGMEYMDIGSMKLSTDYLKKL